MRVQMALGILSGVLALGSACASLEERIPEQPDVELQTITLNRMTPDSVEMNVDLRVLNPNSFDLNAAAFRYQVDVEGDTVAAGRTIEPMKLEAQRVQTITLPLRMEKEAAARFIQDYQAQKQKLPLEFLATLSFESPIGPLSVDVRDETELKKTKSE